MTQSHSEHSGEEGELWDLLATGMRVMRRSVSRLSLLLAAEGIQAHRDGLDAMRDHLDRAEESRREAQKRSSAEQAARLADELPGYPAKG